MSIPWDDHLPPGPPVRGDHAASNPAPAWIGAVPPTPPPVSPRGARRSSGQVWMVMAGVVVALALVTALLLVTSAT